MTMITPSYLGETIEYSSLHACRSTLEDPTTTAVSELLSTEGTHKLVISQRVERPRPLAGDINDRISYGLFVKPLLRTECRLNAAEQQPAASKQRTVKFFRKASFGFGIEIDHDAAADRSRREWTWLLRVFFSRALAKQRSVHCPLPRSGSTAAFLAWDTQRPG